jgi:ribosome maturation factor RimP
LRQFQGDEPPDSSRPTLGDPAHRSFGLWQLEAKVLMAVKLDLIRAAAIRVAESHGLEVVDLELVGPAKERTLRVYLERNAEGRTRLKAELESGVMEDLPARLASGDLNADQLSGITHEDCTGFSRDFGTLLDVEDLIPGDAYTLEASSPGLDRKLTKPDEFRRFRGALVKVQTFEAIRSNRHWQGRIESTTETAMVLDLSAVKQNSKSRKAGVSTVEIAFENIEKANLVPEI